MKRITFCGHRDFYPTDQLKQEVIKIITDFVGDEDVEFLLGGYGNFDAFALSCCKEYKKAHPNSTLIFVSPYLDDTYLKNKNSDLKYDLTIYPPLENTPKKYAILKRNEYMVANSDLLIAYVLFGFGGAAKTLNYAKRKNKACKNVAALR